MAKCTEDSLDDRIRLGEDPTLVLKPIEVGGGLVKSPDQDDLADELAAMANGTGGTVVLGMDDVSREVLGIPLDELDAAERWVRDICIHTVEPELDAYIRKLTLNNTRGLSLPIILVDVPRSLFVHRSPGGYFRRVGSSKREMPPDVLARLFQERSHGRLLRFDESAVPRTKRSDLHGSLAERFAGHSPLNDTMRNLRILVSDDGIERLTVAGVLLCTSDPQRWLPHAYIQAVSYAGERTDIDYQTDARDIGGPLDEQIGEVLHFVRRNMLVRAHKWTARIETPQFSERAVFEALVNAVAHRDYSMLGSRIRLHLFGDRLELYVPGMLAKTITTDSLHLRQACRNELVVSLLARCPAPTGLDRTRLIDRRGDGVPIIREECERLSNRLPEYSLIDESELRLIMWAAS